MKTDTDLVSIRIASEEHHIRETVFDDEDTLASISCSVLSNAPK